MKRDKQPTAFAVECSIPNCIECVLCKALNPENYKSGGDEYYSGEKSLYSAEALNYYFHFVPATTG